MFKFSAFWIIQSILLILPTTGTPHKLCLLELGPNTNVRLTALQCDDDLELTSGLVNYKPAWDNFLLLVVDAPGFLVFKFKDYNGKPSTLKVGQTETDVLPLFIKVTKVLTASLGKILFVNYHRLQTVVHPNGVSPDAFVGWKAGTKIVFANLDKRHGGDSTRWVVHGMTTFDRIVPDTRDSGTNGTNGKNVKSLVLVGDRTVETDPVPLGIKAGAYNGTTTTYTASCSQPYIDGIGESIQNEIKAALLPPPSSKKFTDWHCEKPRSGICEVLFSTKVRINLGGFVEGYIDDVPFNSNDYTLTHFIGNELKDISRGWLYTDDTRYTLKFRPGYDEVTKVLADESKVVVEGNKDSEGLVLVNVRLSGAVEHTDVQIALKKTDLTDTRVTEVLNKKLQKKVSLELKCNDGRPLTTELLKIEFKTRPIHAIAKNSDNPEADVCNRRLGNDAAKDCPGKTKQVLLICAAIIILIILVAVGLILYRRRASAVRTKKEEEEHAELLELASADLNWGKIKKEKMAGSYHGPPPQPADASPEIEE